MATLNRRSLLAFGCLAGTAALSETSALGARMQDPDPVQSRADRSRGLHHIAIRVRDWERTLRFYREALGYGVKLAWEESTGTLGERLDQRNARGQRWAYIDTGNGTYLEIFEDPSFVPPNAGESDPVKSPGGALVHFGVRTSDIDGVCRRARAHGGMILEEPSDYTLHTTTGQGAVTVRLCFLEGPNGEYIELLEHAP